MFSRRRLLKIAATLTVLVALLIVPMLLIHIDSSGRITSDPGNVSHHQVAIVLGAGLTGDGKATWFLRDRLDAAIRLPAGQGGRAADER